MCAKLPWTPKNSQWWLSSDNAEVNLGDTRYNDMKTRKVYADGNKHCPEKEWMLYAQ